MEMSKNVIITVVVVAFVAVLGAGAAYALISTGNMDSDDAASSSDIKSDLEKFASILNDSSKTTALFTNYDMFKNHNSYSNGVTPIKGTVHVNGLCLEFDTLGGLSGNEKHHWIIPYHAINGVREVV